MARRPAALLATMLCLLAPLASAQPLQLVKPVKPPRPDPGAQFHRMVQRVANMVEDDRATRTVKGHGLQLLNVLWEDTGRWEGSSVGPNISDVTIEVEGWRKGKAHRTYLMPVMRHDNFSDKTADVKLDRILIPVGNHRGSKLELVSLKELLASPGPYLSAADHGKIRGGTLLAKRDSHALVSAQHAFLPVPKEGQATFWPVIFNYQSTKRNPAVLTILVTRQGTSMTIIDNARDTVGSDGSWGQRLYFNKQGEKAPLIAERLADVKASGTTANGEDAQDLGSDSNVLMLIQVPLKYREPPRRAAGYGYGSGAGGSAEIANTPAAAPSKMAPSSPADASRGRSDVDVAVLGHGATEGPYTELDGLTITRDPRFPVRVTLQFYQATSNGVVSSADVKAMAAQIKKVYGKGDYVGSLVVPTGLDRQRPTNWDGVTTAPAVSWLDFPGIVERLAKLGVPAAPTQTIGIK
ncbi:MAG: hypothetical protein M3680_26360 [Myxococcota bacterium]|nr:hypothetical protein [Myxococcota bacterium]